MTDYISKAEAINTILGDMQNGESNMEEIFNTALRKAASRIETIPAADVVPVEHGKWGNRQICSNMCGYEYAMMCSVCNKPTYRISMMEDMPPYCQFCGAKMNGGGAGA